MYGSLTVQVYGLCGRQDRKKCVYDPDTGIAAYDLSKTGNTISASDGKRYCVIFSANTGVQTYNVVMDGKCIGDTLYCTGNKLENPDDSEKKSHLRQFGLRTRIVVRKRE